MAGRRERGPPFFMHVPSTRVRNGYEARSFQLRHADAQKQRVWLLLQDSPHAVCTISCPTQVAPLSGSTAFFKVSLHAASDMLHGHAERHR
jgi:hypothetical protein